MTAEFKLPQDVDAEEQVLAYVDYEPFGRGDLLAALTPGEFIGPPRGKLWEAWQRVAAEHTAPGANELLVRDWLRQHDPHCDESLAVLAHIAGTVTTNLPPDPLGTVALSLAATIRRLALQRAGIDLQTQSVGRLYQRGCDPVAELEDVCKRLTEQVAARAPEGENSLNSYFVSTCAPDPMREAAFYGLAGDVVRLLAPHTESDKVALLLQFLDYFGAVVGPGPHWWHEATKHRLNLDTVLVGPSSKSRKGTSKDRIQALFEAAEPGWADEHVISGLSSGEGLIAAVADAADEQADGGGGGQDPRDKREKHLLVFESEFSGPLQHMSREGNILSNVLRDAWDKPNLRTLTKRDPLVASGSYISLIGHITSDDLAKYMTATLAGDGLGNRILWAAVKRADHLLPFGGELHPQGWDDLVERLKQRIRAARQVGSMGLTDEAKDLWQHAYPLLSADRPGLFGKLTGRAEAQTRRLACHYALLDGETLTNVDHLQAALAIWEYCEASVACVFGDATGVRLADDCLRLLREAGAGGLTRTELSDALGHNERSQAITEALVTLGRLGLATRTIEPPEGKGRRPVERWRASRGGSAHVVTKYEFNEFTRGQSKQSKQTPIQDASHERQGGETEASREQDQSNGHHEADHDAPALRALLGSWALSAGWPPLSVRDGATNVPAGPESWTHCLNAATPADLRAMWAAVEGQVSA